MPISDVCYMYPKMRGRAVQKSRDTLLHNECNLAFVEIFGLQFFVIFGNCNISKEKCHRRKIRVS